MNEQKGSQLPFCVILEIFTNFKLNSFSFSERLTSIRLTFNFKFVIRFRQTYLKKVQQLIEEVCSVFFKDFLISIPDFLTSYNLKTVKGLRRIDRPPYSTRKLTKGTHPFNRII